MRGRAARPAWRPGVSAALLASLLVAGCVVAPPPPGPRVVSGARWEPGFYGPAGAWHPGHWIGGGGGPPPEALEAPSGYGPGRHWVRGFYGPEGGWHPGHWEAG